VSKPIADRAEMTAVAAHKTGYDPEAKVKAAAIAAARQKSRVGKAGLLTQHDPAVIQQLKLIALEKNTTQQKLVADALNMLFMKHGKAQIAT
jgi:hypothetical protein